MYNPITGKIIMSRDVIFLEDEKFNNKENFLMVNEDDSSDKVEKMEVSDPKTYNEALSGIEADKWKEAMDIEYKSCPYVMIRLVKQ